MILSFFITGVQEVSSSTTLIRIRFLSSLPITLFGITIPTHPGLTLLSAISSFISWQDDFSEMCIYCLHPLDHLLCLDSLFVCSNPYSSHARGLSGPIKSAGFVTRVPLQHCSHIGSSRNLCGFTRNP